MLLFLRNEKNRTIAEMTIYIDYDDKFVDVSTSIDIVEYSNFLLSLPGDRRENAIERITMFYEFRTWLWEVHFAVKENTPNEYDEVCLIAQGMADLISKELGLNVVQD